MPTKEILQLVTTVGFNGALVLLLLYGGYKFLGRVLNHVSHLDAELKNHTSLLQTINASLETLAKRE